MFIIEICRAGVQFSRSTQKLPTEAVADLQSILVIPASMSKNNQDYAGGSAPPPPTMSTPPPQLKMTTIGGVDFAPSLDSHHLMLKEETYGMNNCCAPGGCCVGSPSRKLFNSQGELVRVNVPYVPLGWCGPSKGVLRKDLVVPRELAARGLTQERWEYWIDQLSEAQKHRASCCCTCISRYTCILLPCFASCICSKYKEQVEDWSRELFDWQVRFNSELAKLGIFVKTKSVCFVYRDLKGNHRNRFRWLAFSFEQADTQMLQNEPHMSGDVVTGCCGGPSEWNCPMHP